MYAAVDLDGEKEVCAYEVQGLGIEDGKWLVYYQGDFFTVGDDLCKLTKEEAERALLERSKR